MNVRRVFIALLSGTLGAACGGSSGGEDAPVVATCDGGACGPDAGSSAADASSPKGCTSDEGLAQEKGDCKKAICDASGAIVTVADDTDVPDADECAEIACVAGQKVSKPKAAGSACKEGKCDGTGGCAKDLGAACSDNSACGTGFCVDGVCCNSACTDECKVCNLAESKGTCSNVPYYEADPSYLDDGVASSCDIPIAGSRCDGKGMCLKLVGKACLQGKDCMSNVCAGSKCLGAPGESCNMGANCASGTCAVGSCK